jgi:predicted AAA+ superfamily ATPase
MLKRLIEKDIQNYIEGESCRTLFVWGPRRSGKTTLLNKIASKLKLPIFNFDLISEQEKFMLDKSQLAKLAQLPIILIDEIQNYPQATLALKILHDEFEAKIIATGSSELRQKGEQFDSLAGRFNELYCLPLSLEETAANTNLPAYEQKSFIENIILNFQVYGGYPEIYTTSQTEEKINLLQNILDTYVLKDIVSIYDLKSLKLAKDILTKIALQLGSEVSYREIAKSLTTSPATVANYIEIFVKNYILIPLPAFKTNLRRAISQYRKLYFYDLGIRNVLIKDFRDLHLRQDRGGVFENFVVSELDKTRKNHQLKFSSYFYREYSGRELDIVLSSYWKKYVGWEVKLKGDQAKKVFPLPHKLAVITPDNVSAQLRSLRQSKFLHRSRSSKTKR